MAATTPTPSSPWYRFTTRRHSNEAETTVSANKPYRSNLRSEHLASDRTRATLVVCLLICTTASRRHQNLEEERYGLFESCRSNKATIQFVTTKKPLRRHVSKIYTLIHLPCLDSLVYRDREEKKRRLAHTFENTNKNVTAVVAAAAAPRLLNFD
jgi:hypothetical protein